MSGSDWKMRPRLLPTIGLIVGMLVSIEIAAFFTSGTGNQTAVSEPSLLSLDGRDPKTVARPHLNWATAKCLSEVERPLEQVMELFAEARRNSRAFAEEALGWDSKLTIVSDYFQQTSEHSAFLKRKFESLVLSEEALMSALQRGIEEYQQSTKSIEGEMLVRLRSDAADFANAAINSRQDTAALQSLFQQAVSQAGTAAGMDLQAAVGREVASFILGEIATQVGMQLGVNAGILSTGAATGWSSFGISVIVGLAVDQMVTAAYDAYADPKGQLASQINAQLDEMERVIIDGADGRPGLRSHLQQFARERSTLRETVVLKLLQSEQGGVF